MVCCCVLFGVMSCGMLLCAVWWYVLWYVAVCCLVVCLVVCCCVLFGGMSCGVLLCAVWCPEHGGRIFFEIGLLSELHDVVSQESVMLTHNSGRVTQVCIFNTVKLGTSASSP